MKKIILLLTFVAMTAFSFSQEDTSELVTDSNVEKLVDKYSAKLEASIISLAETLKQPAEYVYEVLIKQQYVKAYASIVPWIIFIGLLPIFISLMKKGLILKNDNYGNEHNYFYYNDSFTVITVVVGILTIASLIAGAICLQYVIQGFINPDFGAMQDIVNMIK